VTEIIYNGEILNIDGAKYKIAQDSMLSMRGNLDGLYVQAINEDDDE
jgi:hypothetical protein